MHKLLLPYGVFLTVLLAPPAAAQQWTGSIKVGGAVTTFTGDSNADFRRRAGIAGGLALGYDFGSGFILQPELLYVLKGAVTDRVLVTDQGTEVNEELRWSISYADLSLLFMYRYEGRGTWHPKVFAGPTLGRRLDATVRSRTDDLTQTSTDDTIEDSDTGVTIGAGVETDMGAQRVSFEVRGAFGRSNVRGVEPALHNTGVLFLIGLVF